MTLKLDSVYARGSDGEFHLHAKAVKERKTRTNYDLFHEMKPYELADFLAQLMDCCFNSGRWGECDEECPMYDCCNTCGLDNVEDWLMQEAKE